MSNASKRCTSETLAVAARRQPVSRGNDADAEVVSVQQLRRVVEREPRVCELEMLRLIAEGLTNLEIGQPLYLSEATGKTQILFEA